MSDFSSIDYDYLGTECKLLSSSFGTITSLTNLENSECADKIHLSGESLRQTHAQKTTKATELVLERCSMTEAVVETLCAGMYERIGVLNLTGCYLGRLASIEPLVSALSRCPTLQTLILPHNHLNDLQVDQLATVFPSLTGLSVLDLEANELRQCPGLRGLTSLRDLNLKNNLLDQAAWSEVITQCVELKVNTLRFWRVNLSAEMLRMLSFLLPQDSLTCCELLDVQLPENVTLSAFDLDFCDEISVRNVQGLNLGHISLAGLRHLDLSYCGIRSAGLKQIGELFYSVANTLEFLGLSGNFCDESSAKAIASHIPQIENLTVLELASFCTTSAAFNVLLLGMTSSNLEVLDLSGNLLCTDPLAPSNLAKALAKCKLNLRKLNLADNFLQSLAPFGLELTKLESLNLERTELKNQRETLFYLQNCTSLKTLNLGSVDFISSDQEPIVAFCLKPEHLFLPNTSPTLDLLSVLISQATCLRELDLSGARLSPQVLGGFAGLLPDSLEVLNLAYTDWGDMGCEVLLLIGNWKLTKMKSLNLSCNGISDEGVGKLMQAWKSLSKLRILNLAGNIIKGRSFENQQPYANSDLAVLDLRKNPFELSSFPTSLFPCLVEVLLL